MYITAMANCCKWRRMPGGDPCQGRVYGRPPPFELLPKELNRLGRALLLSGVQQAPRSGGHANGPKTAREGISACC